MSNIWILMTAMPPTKGHLNLIRFGASLDENATVNVLVCTQPGEPFFMERFRSLRSAALKMNMPYMRYLTAPVKIHHLHRTLPQDPSTEGFWETWDEIMTYYGCKPGDTFVTSEPYGATLAERMDSKFMPYDPERKLYYAKATQIREHMVDYFHDILPEFQENLRTKITVFGAESTGKTTLSEKLSDEINGHWLFEYARPYLETVGPEITIDSMEAIWKGQLAIQRHAKFLVDKPFVVQDTDLFSTIGYWEQPHWEAELGPVPRQLIKDAFAEKSDLYIITRSNIPFEEDPIRYGGDHRESPDEYWIALAEKYRLNYIVLEEESLWARKQTAARAAYNIANKKAKEIYYEREANG